MQLKKHCKFKFNMNTKDIRMRCIGTLEMKAEGRTLPIFITGLDRKVRNATVLLLVSIYWSRDDLGAIHWPMNMATIFFMRLGIVEKGNEAVDFFSMQTFPNMFWHEEQSWLVKLEIDANVFSCNKSLLGIWYYIFSIQNIFFVLLHMKSA